MRLWGDTETYSELDLREVGSYRYAEACEILLFAYAIDDGPVRVWDLTTGAPMPTDLDFALRFASEVLFHNSMFDRPVLAAHGMAPPLERWRCTMAWALSHALPPSLSELAVVLDVPEDQRKLAEGRKLVRLFTQPRPKNVKIRRATRETHPAEWERFVAYAANDIEAMRECARRMPVWNWDASAIAEWHVDQRINDRGFAVDRELTAAGMRASATEKERIARRFVELTRGAVERPTMRAQFQAYLNGRFGLSLDNTQGETFSRLIKAGGLEPECVELMQLSIAANKTSTAKYAALHPAIGRDGRFRGGAQFAGAGRTRRQAGRIFQYQNLPARGLPPWEMVEQYIGALKAGTHDLFFAHGEQMRYASAALRGCVVAP